MPHPQRPSFKATVINDYPAFLSMMFPIVCVVIVLGILVLGSFPDLKRGRNPVGPDSIPFFLGLGSVALIMGATVIMWRLGRAGVFFKNGIEVPGVITKHRKFRDRGRIYYEYTVKDLVYTTSAPVHFSGAVKSLYDGRKVHVLIMPDDPTKSLLKELYV